MRKLEQHELDQIIWNLQKRGLPVDLSGFDLSGLSLKGASLAGANLWRADLQWADLQRADLQDANLRRADLRGANLRGANLRRANLRGANLWRADLQDANLEDAKLDNVKINWNSHQLLSEFLIRASTNDSQRGLALLIPQRTDLCRKEWLVYDHPEREWALGILRDLALGDENAPSELMNLKGA